MTATPGRIAAGAFALVLAAAPAQPDEVLLRGGGRVTGVVVERTQERIVVETGPGRVSLPLARVERIVEGRSALEAYLERAAGLAPGDTAGWAELAAWAEARDLVTPSREAWQRVLASEPSHPGANAALGRVQMDGAWVSEEEAFRARGYVRFDDRWVTPAEHEALVRERAFEEASERDRHEAELRVREAEARAREAEARAREAEASAQPADGGIPYWWGWGGGVLLPPIDPVPPGPAVPVHPDVRPRPHHPKRDSGGDEPPRARPSTRPQKPRTSPAGIPSPPAGPPPDRARPRPD